MGKNLTLSYSKPKQDFQKEEHHLGCDFQIRRRDDPNSRFFFEALKGTLITFQKNW
ncbi:hypothetical protein N568_0110440 [Lactococcus garvieae TRF1]|uniref:Uncharacterized protein n=1 Tax=Lactococcus garvieae TRF1 TaxID=1380772 RepID=V8AM14_9LACT|nr:hypothetical protein N568_0110440 [Lactococcus garvieae TRF1]